MVYVIAIQMPVAPASAHGSSGLNPTSQETRITAVTPQSSDFTIRPIGFGNRIEVRRTGNATVYIPGYQNEPYLMITNDGVWRNDNSPSRWSNEDRLGLTPLPDFARVSATPNWIKYSNLQWVQWHDHRAHTMVDFEFVSSGEQSIQTVAQLPDGEVIQNFTIDIVVGQTPLVVSGQIVALESPQPSPIVWLVITTCIAIAITSLVRFADRVGVAMGRTTRALLAFLMLVLSLIHAFGIARFGGNQLNTSVLSDWWQSSFYALPGWIALAYASVGLSLTTRPKPVFSYAFGLTSTLIYSGLLDLRVFSYALLPNSLNPQVVQVLICGTIAIGIPLTIEAFRDVVKLSRQTLTPADQNAQSVHGINDAAT